MDSILQSIKLLMGIPSEYDAFDQQLIMHINTTFNVLNQIGIGPDSGFNITGADETWNDFIDGDVNYESVKTYMGMKVRYLFDPPSSSVVMESLNRTIAELEWRLRATDQCS